MKKLKLVAALVLALLVIILILQNTESTETHFLFITVTMPRAVLLLLTTLVGFALGVLTSLILGRKGQSGESET